jgi:hypothetical protein
MERPPMPQHFRFDPSRSLTALEQDSTIIAVIESTPAFPGQRGFVGGSMGDAEGAMTSR